MIIVTGVFVLRLGAVSGAAGVSVLGRHFWCCVLSHVSWMCEPWFCCQSSDDVFVSVMGTRNGCRGTSYWNPSVAWECCV